VGLNALLYKYEQDLAWMADRLGKTDEAAHWRALAAARRSAMDRYLWNPQARMYFDYDFTTGKQSNYDFLTAFYPLWAGAASVEEQKGVLAALPTFEHPGGLAMSNNDSGVQWDLPYGWAPTNWIAVEGMLAAGDHKDAARVAAEFNATVRTSFDHLHIIQEKYDVVTGTSTFHTAVGYHQNVVGFGWTNSVYLEFERLLASRKTR
jgi:alpha,alpha-trehalase